MHAEVGAADSDRGGEHEEDRASGAIRVIAVAQAKDEVAWAEGKLSELGAPPSGGRPSSTGRGTPDDQLDDEVEADRDRAEDPGHDPVLAVVGIDEGEDDPDHQPDRAVLADPPQPLGHGLRRRAVKPGPHRIEQATVEAGEHGGAE